MSDLPALSDSSLALKASLFEGVDTVIHKAVRAHIMNDEAADPLVEFRKLCL